MTTRPLSLKDTYFFFLPLIFMAEMMMISHSVIYAFLARLPDPKVTLAAYNVAFSFHSVIGSPLWSAVMTSLAFCGDRRSVHRLFSFHFQISMGVFAVGYVMALTPLGDWLFGGLMGASAAVVADARRSLLVFMLIPTVSIFRSISYALIMQQRRTHLITFGTLIRLISLAGYLAVLPKYFSGASVGAAALLLCILTETVLAVVVAWRFYIDLPRESDSASHGDMWRFAWPLMLVQGSENGVGFTINFFLGRLVNPTLSLAAFGVLDGLWRVMLAPLRNLAQTAQTLVRSRQDRRVMIFFALQVIAGFTALSSVFFIGPMRHWVLRVVMGLTGELSDALAPALLLFVLLAFTLGTSALFRGLLLATRATGQIAKSAGVRLVLVICIGSLGLVYPGMNGAVLGVLAMIGGFAAEMTVLGIRLRHPVDAKTSGESP